MKLVELLDTPIPGPLAVCRSKARISTNALISRGRRLVQASGTRAYGSFRQFLKEEDEAKLQNQTSGQAHTEIQKLMTTNSP